MLTFVKQLGQAAPVNTTAATLYTRPQNTTAYLDQLFVCNVTGGAVTCRIFYDDDGATYSVGTALYYDKSVAANDTLLIDLKIGMDTANGTVGVQTGTADALTFTLFGEESPL